MAITSVIEIDVLDDKFKEFKSLFDEYRDSLVDSIADWNNTDKGIDKNRKRLKELTDDEKKREKARQKTETDSKKADEERKKRWKDLRDIANDTLKTIGKIGLATGVIGMGLFAAANAGMANLARSASNTRFQSMGLGINAGQLKAAQVNYSSALGSPEQTLSAIRDLQSDVTKQRLFLAAGIKDYEKKSSAEVLPELMKAAQKMAKETPREQLAQVSQAYGYSDVFSLEDLTRFKEMSTQEMDAMIKKADADKRSLSITDAMLKKWQDLQKQIDRFSESLQNVFLNALAPLAPLFTKLSESSLKFIQVFMKSDLMKFLLEKITEGMKEFTDYIAGDKPIQDIKKFVGYIKTGGDVIGGFLDVIKMITDGWRLLWTEIIKPCFEWIADKVGFVSSGGLADAAKSAVSGLFSTNTGGATGSWETGGATGSWEETKKSVNLREKLFAAGKKYNFDANAILANYQSSGLNPSILLAQAYQESGFNPNARSPVGAEGFAQFMPGTASRYGLKDRRDAVQSSSAQVRMMQGLYKKYGSYELALAAYNGGERGADYLARNPQYLKTPDMSKAARNLWRGQTADYQAKILKSAGSQPLVVERGDKDIQGRAIPMPKSPVFKTQQGQSNSMPNASTRIVLENNTGGNVLVSSGALN